MHAGRDFVYYIRTLSVTLGRKTTHTDGVDIDLGKSKSVSRRYTWLSGDQSQAAKKAKWKEVWIYQI